MDKIDLLFQTFSNLFNGVVTDVTTAVLGMIVLMVLVLGGSKLISVFDQDKHESSEDDSDGSSFLFRRKDREDD